MAESPSTGGAGYPIEDAIALAISAHAGQHDKNGEPYIYHLLRVMETARKHREDLAVPAVLHDIIEDTAWTAEELLLGIHDSRVVGLVLTLTRIEGEDYGDYIERVGAVPQARIIKLCDLRDNLREGCPPSLRVRYERAMRQLTGEGVVAR